MQVHLLLLCLLHLAYFLALPYSLSLYFLECWQGHLIEKMSTARYYIFLFYLIFTVIKYVSTMWLCNYANKNHVKTQCVLQATKVIIRFVKSKVRPGIILKTTVYTCSHFCLNNYHGGNFKFIPKHKTRYTIIYLSVS